MTIKEDVLRAKEYGRDPYYQAIQTQPSYQTQLQKVQDTGKERAWIKSPFALPKLTTEQFEAQREKYIAKYGTTVQIPGFEDIIHTDTPAKISEEEMAAHRWAQQRGLPSPLDADQLASLAEKKYRYLKMLASPEPSIQRNITAILTALDNAEDALVTLSVLGRLLVKAAPRLFSRLTPVLGWSLLGSDIINLTNLMGNLSMASMAKKRRYEEMQQKNPFHAKAAAARADKLKRVWPTFGETLEIAQTVDQMFGVGLCLGGIMGMFQDAIDQGMLQIAGTAARIATTIQYPSAWRTTWSDAIDAATMIWATTPETIPYMAEKATMAATGFLEDMTHFQEIKEVMNLIPGFRDLEKKMPTVKDIGTAWILEDSGVDPLAPLVWPIIDKPKATLEEITFTYAPKIKENFQTYLLNHSNDYKSYITGSFATDATTGIIQMFSDDSKATFSQSAYSQSTKEMLRDNIIPPQDITQKQADALNEWIGSYERKYAASPSTKEIEFKGIQLGIKWQTVPPKKIQGKAADLFPEWKALQDQLGELYIAD